MMRREADIGNEVITTLLFSACDSNAKYGRVLAARSIKQGYKGLYVTSPVQTMSRVGLSP